jgi:hypothetical protein
LYQPDGRMVVSPECRRMDGCTGMILSYGRTCRCSPESLREKVRSEAEKILRLYDNSEDPDILMSYSSPILPLHEFKPRCDRKRKEGEMEIRN